MDKRDSFKEFLKNNKSLASLVNDGTTTYQKLFETYDIYGEDTDVWSKIKSSSKNSKINSKSAMEYLKNIDMDKLEENVSSIEKALAFLEEIVDSRNKKSEEKQRKKNKESSIERFFDD